jgi:hypothetical protein
MPVVRASAMEMTLPSRRRMALSKLVRVRVEASKKAVTAILPSRGW